MPSPPVLAIIQARMSSSRLPGKVLKPILGRPMLEHQLARISRARLIDQIVVATSVEASDDPLQAFCASLGIACHRGPLNDVLARFIGAAQAFGPPAHILRLTADCPLADPGVIDACIALHLANQVDYTSNGVERSYPKGLDAEMVSYAALARAAAETSDPYDREHVTPRIYRRPDLHTLQALRYVRDLSQMRWTVDTPADFLFAERVYQELYPANPEFGWLDVLELVQRKPEIAALNS